MSPLKTTLMETFSIRHVLRSAALIYVGLLLFAYVGSDRMIFRPQPCSYEDTAQIIKIPTLDGAVISAKYLPSPTARYTILFNHGNAEDLGDIDRFLTSYREQGFSVFAYDYCGYGTSSGAPSSLRACQAVDAALKYLVETEHIPPERIIVHGRSVGGGPALYLAEKTRIAGVILESTFVSAFRVLTRVPLLPFDKFQNINRVDNLSCPVLIIHSRDDRTIPVWHGEALFHKAKAPKMSCWLSGASHDYMPADARKQYWHAIAAFISLIDSEQNLTE